MGTYTPATPRDKSQKTVITPESEQEQTDISSFIPNSEHAARAFVGRLENYIHRNKAQYVKDEDGSLHLILGAERISLNNTPENHALNGLMLKACGVSTLGLAAKAAIQRLQVSANKEASRMKLRKFSALSLDNQNIYVPINSGKLLRITADQITEVPNGSNSDSFWLEHPEGKAFKYVENDAAAALAHFEHLLVESQACRELSMRWFVAMAEGLFPYIRDLSPARFIVEHTGASQQGKTTGAQRFTILHGLGDVKGDYSVAALRSLGDNGLLVLDNKEQANFHQGLIDFCLFLATGAESARSSKEGQLRRSSGSRPVAVITTIEGVFRDELQKRCVPIEYLITGAGYSRDIIENEIREHRDEISSALMGVLQQFLRNRSTSNTSPNSLPNFPQHFGSLCDLLRACGQIAGKSEGWAEEIIADWDRVLGKQEQEEDELEHPILRVLGVDIPVDEEVAETGIYTPPKPLELTWRGRKGRLFVTEVGSLLTALEKLNLKRLGLPRTASGLGKRLRGREYGSFQVLDEQRAPEMPALTRQAHRKPIGFFIPDDG